MTRWLILPLIITFVINLAAINISGPVHDPDFAALVKLLEWRNPVTGKELYLPLNHNASHQQQIKDLQNLETLDLSNQQLTTLPPGIGSLTGLQVLNLSGNQLRELPAELERLTNVTLLNLAGNELTELPLSQ